MKFKHYMHNSNYKIDLTPASPAYPSHPTWGFTYNQRQAMQAIANIPGFSKFVEFERTFTQQFESSPDKFRPAHHFTLMAIMNNGDYIAWKLPCFGSPLLLAVSSREPEGTNKN